jgi:hypothetical protein
MKVSHIVLGFYNDDRNDEIISALDAAAEKGYELIAVVSPAYEGAYGRLICRRKRTAP